MTETQTSPPVGANADARALQRHLYREIGLSAVAAALAIDSIARKPAPKPSTQAAQPRHAA